MKFRKILLSLSLIFVFVASLCLCAGCSKNGYNFKYANSVVEKDGNFYNVKIGVEVEPYGTYNPNGTKFHICNFDYELRYKSNPDLHTSAGAIYGLSLDNSDNISETVSLDGQKHIIYVYIHALPETINSDAWDYLDMYFFNQKLFRLQQDFAHERLIG